ncbi:hypothetical protein VTK26DRAFT_7147 [Humicola hyalothermophila]
MPTARKRSLRELESDTAQPPRQPSTLHRIRNMWQFANLYQFILLFGSALKLDDNLDIEDLEAECLKPGSMVLQDIGLGFLKFLSSHRGLTHELFDEYTRRQFLSKAPEKNPFGTEETPAKFAEFDVFTKIRVLQQMTQLIMMNPERLRERTEEQKDTDQTSWRIEPYGWDQQDRTYYVLDDNRLYRLTETQPAPPKPKKNTKKARAAQRASKRRRVSSGAASDADDGGDEASEAGAATEPEDDGLGGMKWECVAVTLDEVRQFLSTIQKSKDPNEKTLRDQIQDHLLPILEKQEESRKRKQLQREKELLNLEKLAHAKRSSRIAGKLEQQRLEEKAREEERKRREEEEARKKEELRRLKMERERDNRLMSREQRLKEREARRRRYEEELAALSEDSKALSTASGRMSERRRQAEIERNKKALRELEEEEEDWIFDCVCGVYGQVDDGTHSVACERCNTWQHSKCLGINEEDADRDDFHFICSSCRRRQHAAEESRSRTIKIKVNRPQAQTGSPIAGPAAGESAATSRQPRTQLVVELLSQASTAPAGSTDQANTTHGGSFQDSRTTQSAQTVSKRFEQETGNSPSDAVCKPAVLQPSSAADGTNPFSSPHPNLSPPNRHSANLNTHILARYGATSAPTDDCNRPSTLAGGEGASNGVLSTLAGSGNCPSPSKQPHRAPSPPTKTPLPVPAASNGLGRPVSAGNNISSMASASIAVPHFPPTPAREARSSDAASSPLPPPSAGLSPTKHSPPASQQSQANGNDIHSAAVTPLTTTAVVFPPAATLSPSPRQQILTPPVKPAEPVRVPPQQAVQSTEAPKLDQPGSQPDGGSS